MVRGFKDELNKTKVELRKAKQELKKTKKETKLEQTKLFKLQKKKQSKL